MRKGVRSVAAIASASAVLAAIPAFSVNAATASQDQQYHGTIVISINNSGPVPAAGFKALAAAYHKVQPGVKLVWEPVPQNADYATWLGTKLAAGTPRADIVAGNYQPTYGHYVNFDKYRFTTNPYTGHLWNQDYNWDWDPAPNGKHQMLATQAVHITWFYNKNIFNKLHLTPPRTWNQLVSVAKKLKAGGYIPVTAQYKIKVAQWLYEVYNDQYNRNWAKIVSAKKGDYDYNPALDGKFHYSPKDRFIENHYTLNMLRYYNAIHTGKIKFDTKKTATMIHNLSELFPQYAQPDFFVSQWQDDYNLWIQQKAAIMLDGSWSFGTITHDMKTLKNPQIKAKIHPFQWGTFEMPSMTGPLVEAPARSIESASGEYISAIDKNQQQTDMDVDFVKFWVSKVGYQAWLNGEISTGQFSPAGPVEVYGAKLPKQYADLFKHMKMLGNAENGINAPDLPGPTDLVNKGYLYVENALTGKTTPTVFGKEVESLWQGSNFNEILQGAKLTLQDISDPSRAPANQ